MACPTLSSGDAFLSSLLTHIDCQGRTLGMTGWEALARADSPVSVALSGLLILFVALFGLRMALGQTPGVRDTVMAVARIGIVLTLAASWPAYRTVVYDVIVEGPSQLSALVGAPSNLPGAEGNLIRRLQRADQSIIRLTDLGTGREPGAALPPGPGAASDAAPQRFPIADDPAFGWARIFFLSTTVAAFAIVRLTAGVLLALGPLMAGLLLFNLSRGVFVGWARALVFTLLASVTATLILGVELALLEPWLAHAVNLRRTGATAAAVPVELLTLCLAFAIALFGVFAVLLRLAFMVHVPPERREARQPEGSVITAAPLKEAPPALLPPQPPTDHPPSRALAIADSVAAAQRRERAGARQAGAGTTTVVAVRPSGASASSDDLAIPAFGPAARRSRPRTSIAAGLRDIRS